MISIDIFDTALFSDEYGYFNKKRDKKELKEHCVANRAILNEYILYKERFIFISDDGYDETFLKELLYNCGYDHPTVFIPKKEGVNKKDGSLYKEIEKSTGKKILMHYGDNYEEDIIGALRAGVKGVFNPSLSRVSLDLPDVKDMYLKQYLASSLYYCIEESFDLKPIRVFSSFITPVLLQFSKWVTGKESSPCISTKSLYSVYHILVNSLKVSANFSKNEKDENVSLYPKKRCLSLFGKGGFLPSYEENFRVIEELISSDGIIPLRHPVKEPVRKDETSKKIFLSNIFLTQLIENCEKLKERTFLKEDLIQILSFIRKNKFFLSLYDDILLYQENGVNRSYINYNKDLIKIGYLKELYEKSFDKELFKRALVEDKEYSHLLELL